MRTQGTEFFNHVDVDGNGQVDCEEFKAGLQLQGCHLTEDERLCMWAVIDPSFTGVVDRHTWQAFLAHSYSEDARRRVAQHVVKEYGPTRSAMEKCFDAIDLSANGVICADEMASLLAREGQAACVALSQTTVGFGAILIVVC